MKMRIVCVLLALLFNLVACNNGVEANRNNTDSPENVLLSELHGINHAIRNFQDLLKREPDAKAYTEYADFLERRLKVIQHDFSDEINDNPKAEKFVDAVEKSLPDLRNSEPEKRNLAQKELNKANEDAARELKLN